MLAATRFFWKEGDGGLEGGGIISTKEQVLTTLVLFHVFLVFQDSLAGFVF